MKRWCGVAMTQWSSICFVCRKSQLSPEHPQFEKDQVVGDVKDLQPWRASAYLSDSTDLDRLIVSMGLEGYKTV